ncbi:secretion protein, partial [Candidatus Pelagibacter sp.]|nr:secretion protein [Candidatus Pelagibacter sp.]
MKSIIRFILAFLIINLTFVREGAALESGDFATPLFVQNFSVATEEPKPRGLTFSNDGTKMFVVGEQTNNASSSGGANDDIHEYTLSTAFDISTASYVDSLANAGDNNENSLKFNNDGSKMFVTGRGNNTVREYSLTANFDLSSATFESFFSVNSDDDTLFGLDFNNDGTMMYITGHENDTIHQYELAVGFDLSEGVTLLRSQDLSAQDGEPSSIEFNTDGTRIFIIGTLDNVVDQYDLSTGFDISTLSHVGFLKLGDQEGNPSGIAFSPSGLKMFITGKSGATEVNEYTLNCPFTLFSGNCPSITENSVRTGIAIAQIEVATRTIEHSTDTALNRLKWIRRNKD